MANNFQLILDRIVLVVQGDLANLPRVSATNEIKKRKDWKTSKQPYEGITIHKGGRREQVGGVVTQDDISFPVNVTWAYGSSVDDYDQEDHAELFAQRITKLFNNKRCEVVFTDTSHENYCAVQDNSLDFPKEWRDNWKVCSLRVNVIVRHSRI